MAHTSLLTKLFLIVHKPAEIFKPSGESAKVVKSDVADIMEEEEEEEEEKSGKKRKEEEEYA